MNGEAPVVRLAGLTHRYGTVQAADGVDLEIPAGRMVGFIGPDGVGKSTWLGLIAGARQIQQGRVEVLGGGHRRTRGCFWLPTRPTQVCQWEGAGGMLSIGTFDDWYDMRPHTRIVVVGTDEGREELETALRSCLLTDDEIERHGLRWRVPGDGLEPWLGPVDGVSEVA